MAGKQDTGSAVTTPRGPLCVPEHIAGKTPMLIPRANVDKYNHLVESNKGRARINVPPELLIEPTINKDYLFKCKRCDFKTDDADAFTEHVYSNHAEPMAEKEVAVTPVSPADNTPAQGWKCEDCGFMAKSEVGLKVHRSAMHKEVKE